MLGAGNLGCSLIEELMRRKIPVKLFSITINNWKYPQSLDPILKLNPDHIWVCLGSIHNDHLQTWDTNIRLTLELLQKTRPQTILHFFSTVMVVDKELSRIKRHMEEIIFESKRPNTNVYRISHVYGKYKPYKSLPYLIHKNRIRVAKETNNMICPTPADWLAKEIIYKTLDKIKFDSDPSNTRAYIAIPSDTISFESFKNFLIEGTAEVKSEKNNQFNHYSTLNYNAPSWLDLWQERKIEWEKYAKNSTPQMSDGTGSVPTKLLDT